MRNETLTVNLITRSFVICLQQLYPFELNPDAVQHGQLHVDFALDQSELDQSLEEFVCRIIEPAAASLAHALKTRGARYSLPLELPTREGLSCCRTQYEGCNLRGIIEHNYRIHTADGPLFVEAARFDIAWGK